MGFCELFLILFGKDKVISNKGCYRQFKNATLGTMEGLMNILQRYQGDALERHRSWANLGDEALRRRAMAAASSRDLEELWGLVEAYLAHSSAKGSHLSVHTLSTYRRGMYDLAEHWQGVNLLRPGTRAGGLYLEELEQVPYRIDRLADQEVPRFRSPATVNVKLAAARTFYHALAWAGATNSDPFKGLRSRKDPVPAWEKRQPYETREIEVLLETADDPADRVAILLGSHAGLRRHETAGLRWEDLRFDVRLARVKGKGGYVESVGLSKRLLTELRELRSNVDSRKRRKEREGFIMPWGDKRMEQRFKALCTLAGVDYDRKGLHGLRHSAGTRMYRQTRDLNQVQKHLRHKNITTTTIYAKLEDEATRRTVEDW
jgi:integrase/recombinase XerC